MVEGVWYPIKECRNLTVRDFKGSSVLALLSVTAASFCTLSSRRSTWSQVRRQIRDRDATSWVVVYRRYDPAAVCGRRDLACGGHQTGLLDRVTASGW